MPNNKFEDNRKANGWIGSTTDSQMAGTEAAKISFL